MELSPPQIRVLGCLVEKQLTTPQQYPMTETALIGACNQSHNRWPVVAYEQATVRRALLDLRQQGLAKMVHRHGDRVEKHRHLLDDALSLSPGEVAVLAVLMLRGSQTPGELRTRTQRLHRFDQLSQLEAVLEALAQRAPDPLVERLEQLPGQSQTRYRHLLGAEVEDDVTDVGTEAAPAPGERTVAAGSDLALLRAEVDRLRARVERLERGAVGGGQG